jgi:hypothetical protein
MSLSKDIPLAEYVRIARIYLLDLALWAEWDNRKGMADTLRSYASQATELIEELERTS